MLRYLGCFRPNAARGEKPDWRREQTLERHGCNNAPSELPCNETAHIGHIETTRQPVTETDASASVAATQALCFEMLVAQSPSIISIFTDTETSDGRMVYQNKKSQEYYGDLGRAAFGSILGELLAFENSSEVSFTSILSELNSSGSWLGTIKVPHQLRPDEEAKDHLDPVMEDEVPSPVSSKIRAAPALTLNEIVSEISLSGDECCTFSHQRSLNLPRNWDAVSTPLSFDEAASRSATLRGNKVPKRVKSLLQPSFHSTISKSIGSYGSALNSRCSADRQLTPSIDLVRESAAGCSSLLSNPGVLSQTASTQGKSTFFSKIDVVKAAIEAEIPQLLEVSSSGGLLGTPPRVHSIQECTYDHTLNVLKEVDREGIMSIHGSINGLQGQPFQWHDVNLKRARHPMTGEPLILVTQSDATVRVAMEEAMLACTASQLNMVSSIFPSHVVDFLSTQKKNKTAHESAAEAARQESQPGIGQLARSHKDVSILFMDIVGFTSMSKEVEPSVVMKFLNDLFGAFDHLIDEYQVQKVETAGDCYIVSAGVLATGADGFSEVLSSHDPLASAARVLSFAQSMLRHSKTMKMPHNGEPVLIRIGIHSGDCVSGLIGSRMHKFGLFGDTMNCASRMESTCVPGRIQISASTYAMLHPDQQALFEATGGVEVKGKGQMDTYLWLENSSTHNLGLLDFSPLDGMDLEVFLGRRCSNGLSPLIADSLLPREGALPHSSKRSVQHGSGQTISPFVTATQACQEAVQLLHSFAKTRNYYRRASTAVLQLEMQGSLLMKLTEARARRSPTSHEEVRAPIGLRIKKSASSQALSAFHSLSDQIFHNQ